MCVYIVLVNNLVLTLRGKTLPYSSPRVRLVENKSPKINTNSTSEATKAKHGHSDGKQSEVAMVSDGRAVKT